MQFNKTTLSNGLRVITVPMADNPSVTVLVMVQAGSKYETKDIGGLSHFLEHMVFKGTTKRPKASDISRELDSLGAHYNAFTSHEYTGYYAKADKRHLDSVIDIVSDMYVDPIFDSSEIEKEKGVIIEEMRMYQDMPQRHIFDVLFTLLYGDQPAGWNIVGTEKTIRSFNKDSFVSYRAKHYVTKATTVVVAGSFDEKNILKKVEEAFSKIANTEKDAKLPVKESQSSPQIKIEFKETDQTHLAIALRTFPVNDKRMPTMQVLSSILGKGMSSRLFSKMRDQLGICYYVRAEQDSYTDHGALIITAGVDNSRVEQAIKGILEECVRLKNEPVGDAELQKVKDHIAGTTMLELETSDARSEFVGFQEVLKGKVDSPDEILEKINKVTAQDIKKLAQEIFVNEGLNMAVIGKYKDDSAFKKYLVL